MIKSEVREAIRSILADPGMTTDEKLVGAGLTLRYIPNPPAGRSGGGRPFLTRATESARIRAGLAKKLVAYLISDSGNRAYS